MDERRWQLAIQASDPTAPSPAGHEPANDRMLWDWGDGTRVALTADGRLRLMMDDTDAVLPVAAWLELLRRYRES